MTRNRSSAGALRSDFQMPYRTRSMQRHGFTLVETIVVVAIVAVLASLITAATFRGIAEAKKSACANNLRQIGLSLEAYMADHDGYYPSASWHGGKSAGANHKPVPANPRGFIAALDRYGAKPDVWYSPTDPYARRSFQGEFVRHDISSYWLHAHVFGLSGVTPVGGMRFTPSMSHDPSNAIAFMLDTVIKKEADGKPVRWSSQGRTVNALMVDGRVKALPNMQPDGSIP